MISLKNELPLPKQINFLSKDNVQILITEFLESRELCSDYILETRYIKSL